MIELPMGDGRALDIAWKKRDISFFTDKKPDGYRFLVRQLRDSCSCTACRDVSSGQKSYATTQLPADMEITNVEITEQKGLVVTVNKDMETHGGSAGHDIHLSPEWVLNRLKRRGGFEPGPSKLLRRFQVDYWDKSEIESKVRRVDYEQFMQDSEAFWDVIQDIVRLGIVFLRNVPRDEDAVTRIATHIANIRETFYGRTFDVRAKPNAENVAYTSGYLGLHQDLMYLNPPPFVQILHCMDNSCEGGESLFSDADRVGRMLNLLRKDCPMASRLAKVRVPYGYTRNGKYYRRRRALLNLSEDNEYENVFWSPPFQAEWQLPTFLDDWAAAARVFEEAVNDTSAVYQTRMEPGDCVLFNNIRVLHGRKAFDAAGGSRWLRGTYIASEDFASTAMHAPESHATSMDDRESWWNPTVANQELMTTPTYGQLKSKLLDAESARRGSRQSKKGGMENKPW